MEAMDAVLVNPELIAPHVPYAPTSGAVKEAVRLDLEGARSDADEDEK